MVSIFPKLCLWRRSLCSNLGSIGPEKLYRATLSLVLRKTRIQNQFPLSVFVFIDSLRNCFCFTKCGWLYDFPPKKPRVAFGLPNVVILHWYASGADGRAGGRGYGHVATSHYQKFLGRIDNHIFLLMVFRYNVFYK